MTTKKLQEDEWVNPGKAMLIAIFCPLFVISIGVVIGVSIGITVIFRMVVCLFKKEETMEDAMHKSFVWIERNWRNSERNKFTS